MTVLLAACGGAGASHEPDQRYVVGRITEDGLQEVITEVCTQTPQAFNDVVLYCTQPKVETVADVATFYNITPGEPWPLPSPTPAPSYVN